MTLCLTYFVKWAECSKRFLIVRYIWMRWLCHGQQHAWATACMPLPSLTAGSPDSCIAVKRDRTHELPLVLGKASDLCRVSSSGRNTVIGTLSFWLDCWYAVVGGGRKMLGSSNLWLSWGMTSRWSYPQVNGSYQCKQVLFLLMDILVLPQVNAVGRLHLELLAVCCSWHQYMLWISLLPLGKQWLQQS